MVANIERATIDAARRKPPESLDAYEIYLQGRELTRSSTKSSVLKAHRLFQTAIELDPTFALPFAQLAFARYLAVALHWDLANRQRLLDEGFTYARRALEWAPSLHFANLVSGELYLRQHEYDEAVQWGSKALQLNPGDAECHSGLANIFTFVGRSNEAVCRVVRMIAAIADALVSSPQPNEQSWSALAEGADYHRRGTTSARAKSRPT
jgi:tetratricopeptide (TPR) repeat protein